jgi:hypothetical protein
MFGNFNKNTVITNAGDDNEVINDFITLFCKYYAQYKKQVSINSVGGHRRLIIKRDFISKQVHTLTNDKKYLPITDFKIKTFIRKLFNTALKDEQFSDPKFDKDKFFIDRVSRSGKPLAPELDKRLVNTYVDKLVDMASLPTYSKESLRVNKDDAAESLVCLALHYVDTFNNGSVSSFQDYIEFDLPSSISQLSLPFSVSELRWYCSSQDPYLTWAISSFIMAEKIKNSPAVTNISSLNGYTFCHSKSDIGKKFKNDIFSSNIILSSGIKVGEDKIQPSDIFLVKTSLMNRLSPSIRDTDPITIKFDKLERFYNHNFKTGVLIPVSLKQTIYQSSTQKTTTQIKAVNYNPQGTGKEILTPRLLSDFIMRELLLAKKKVATENHFIEWFDKFIEIEPINYKNYKDQVNTTIKFRGTTYNNKQAAPITFDLMTPNSTYNFQRVGGNSWTGGISYQVVSKIIRTDAKIKIPFNKAIGHLLSVKKKYFVETFGKNNWSQISSVLRNDLSSIPQWEEVIKQLSKTYGAPTTLLFAYNYLKYISSKNVPYTTDLPKLMNSLGVSQKMLEMMVRKNPTKASFLSGYIEKGRNLTGEFGSNYNQLNYKLLGQKLADYEAFYIFSQIQNVVTEHFKKQYMVLIFSLCTGRGGVISRYNESNKTTYEYLAGTRPMTHLLVGD